MSFFIVFVSRTERIEGSSPLGCPFLVLGLDRADFSKSVPGGFPGDRIPQHLGCDIR